MQFGSNISTAGILGNHPEFTEQQSLPVVPSEFPFLIEKATGVVYPYTPQMAERGDLVEGCYDLRGSKNPKDRPPNYDPMVAASIQRRQDAQKNVLPKNQAEMQARLIEAEQQIEARIRAEYETRNKGTEQKVIEVEPVGLSNEDDLTKALRGISEG